MESKFTSEQVSISVCIDKLIIKYNSKLSKLVEKDWSPYDYNLLQKMYTAEINICEKLKRNESFDFDSIQDFIYLYEESIKHEHDLIEKQKLWAMIDTLYMIITSHDNKYDLMKDMGVKKTKSKTAV